ncbi:YsnF/AvaK domain-containing protein [Pleurocapsa sp. FMAR1]|uniref:YsnF/AvaK domain-containing protein n=1 Tax=Pleurocapsa sp. FMAR1 TaxID=3040204 RepID=UPI0029C9A99D|nr:YsnF/AvaK domain-containing protein [Pleurocapsa sp. FMAR1]
MNSTSHKRAAGLFHNRDKAESAVHDLKDSGYDMHKVSIIAKDADQIDGVETTEKIGDKADDGATTGALTGGTLGGITGLLVGLGTLAIPGVGPILLAGAGATTIATTLAGAGIGVAAGGLVGALVGLGIPEEKAKIYTDSVKDGSFLVMVNGTEAEIARAEAIMHHHGIEEFGIYDAPTSNAESTVGANIAHIDEDIKTRTDIADGEKIKLYEERLTVNKQRAKTGEVSIGKRVETEIANISVPVEKERLVIERKNVMGEAISPETVHFGDGETVNVDLYEETATINKQVFVREEVNVHKEVEQETVQKSETIRREELEIDEEGDVIRH